MWADPIAAVEESLPQAFHRKEWEKALLDNVAASAKQPPAVLTYYYYLDLGVCFGGEWKVSGLVSCRFPLLSESKQLAYPHTRDADVR